MKEEDVIRIAVVGGGVSGLTLCHRLVTQIVGTSAQHKIHISVFDAHEMGGAAQTFNVVLGEQKSIGPGDDSEPFVRVVDLGVNDINISTYLTIREIMESVGFDYEKRMASLENSAVYYPSPVPGSSGDVEIITDDSDLSDGQIAQSSWLDAKKRDLLKLVRLDGIRRIGEKSSSEKYRKSVGIYFKDCIEDPQKMLKETADEYKIPIDWKGWVDLPETLEALRDRVFYPRMSAMYFADAAGPVGSPMEGPFGYYALQESRSSQRRYFKYGAQDWTDHIVAWLEAICADIEDVELRLRKNEKVTKISAENEQVVVSAGGSVEAFDYCVVSLHADAASDVLKEGGHEGRLIETLDRVKYVECTAYAHTDARLMPTDTRCWRTYNVLQRTGGLTMTYYMNRHRNDSANPNYNRVDYPDFFVSLNPVLIPEHVLEIARNCEANQLLPRSSQAFLRGLGESDRALSAKVKFRHNVVNQDCFEAQAYIKTRNEDAQQRILFAGAWTEGVGLHEECALASQKVADLLLSRLPN